MKTVFNEIDYAELVKRIESAKPETQRIWGKMNVAQMMAHNSAAVELALGDVKLKRKFIGYLLGGFIKKSFLSEKPFPKDSPTAAEIIITDARDLENEKAKLLQLLKRMYLGGEKGATTHPHSFFGKLTPQQWGETQWKHLDHHLRQFGL